MSATYWNNISAIVYYLSGKNIELGRSANACNILFIVNKLSPTASSIYLYFVKMTADSGSIQFVR